MLCRKAQCRIQLSLVCSWKVLFAAQVFQSCPLIIEPLVSAKETDSSCARADCAVLESGSGQQQLLRSLQ